MWQITSLFCFNYFDFAANFFAEKIQKYWLFFSCCFVFCACSGLLFEIHFESRKNVLMRHPFGNTGEHFTVLLVRFGVATIDQLKQARPYVIVGAFVVAAVVTPPDVISQLLLAIPLCLLYEFGLQVARFTGLSPSRAEADAQAAAEAAESDAADAGKQS